jgi:hypothetical protein
MAVSPGEAVRTILRTVGTGETLYANTYYCELLGGPSVSDTDVLTDMEDWATLLFASLQSALDSDLDLSVCQVDVVEVTGTYDPDPALNTAKVDVVRPLGFITPTFSPGASGEEIDGISTMSIVPGILSPGHRSRKSISGFTENQVSQKIFTNGALSAGATFAINWTIGPSQSGSPNPWFAGVLSLKDGEMHGYDGTFTIKNYGGNMVTRKIGRGS